MPTAEAWVKERGVVTVAALVERYNAYTTKLREGIEAADEAGDEDTADLFTEVSRAAEKDAWFIGSNSSAAA